jgi:hypothetical protein
MDDMTFSIMAFSIMTLRMITLSIIRLRMITLGILINITGTLSINDTRHDCRAIYAERFMLIVFMLSVVPLNATMLRVVMGIKQLSSTVSERH